LAGKILTLFQTGDLPLRHQVREQVPAGLRDLLGVPGLGPKRAQVLYRQLGIPSLDKLREAAQEHPLRQVKGFGTKTEENIPAGGPGSEGRGQRASPGPIPQAAPARALGQVMPICEEAHGDIMPPCIE
jgi:DNA polymerase/3'-5' exonuclease PolX